MALKVQKKLLVGLTLSQLKLPDELRDTVQRATQKEDPRYEDVFEAEQHAQGLEAQQLHAAVLSYQQARLANDVPVLGASGIQSAGKAGVTSVLAKNVPVGQTPSQAAMREALGPATVGQSQVIEPFVSLLGELENPLRPTPSFMALLGEPSRGQQEAVKGFAQQAAGEKAYVAIDLSGAGQGAVPPELAVQELQKRLKALPAVKGKTHALVIHVKGIDQLASRSPEAASALAELLTTRRGQPGYVNAVFAFELDGPETGDPRTLLIEALSGPNSESSWVNEYAPRENACFGMLSPEAMMTYAERALVDIFRETPELAPHRLKGIEEQETRRLLGEALATPHLPLKELRPRLERLIRSGVQLGALSHPEGAVLSLMVTPEVTEDATLGNGLVHALQQPNPDYGDLEKLFWFVEQGKLGRKPKGAAWWKEGADLKEALTKALKDLSSNSYADRAVLGVKTALSAALEEAEKNLNGSFEMLVAPSTLQSVRDALAGAGQLPPSANPLQPKMLSLLKQVTAWVDEDPEQVRAKPQTSSRTPAVAKTRPRRSQVLGTRRLSNASHSSPARRTSVSRVVPLDSKTRVYLLEVNANLDRQGSRLRRPSTALKAFREAPNQKTLLYLAATLSDVLDGDFSPDVEDELRGLRRWTRRHASEFGLNPYRLPSWSFG
jgi:hypothetical protein